MVRFNGPGCMKMETGEIKIEMAGITKRTHDERGADERTLNKGGAKICPPAWVVGDL